MELSALADAACPSVSQLERLCCFAPRPPAALTNDHKALTRQMEQLLHALHSRSHEPGGAAQAPAEAPPAAAAARAAAAEPAATAAPPPFAVIDELSAGSPAAEAGLQLGDQLCSFGGVSRGSHPTSTLPAVAGALVEGTTVKAVVLRQGAPLTLQLTPHKWFGQGLLGCHLRPL